MISVDVSHNLDRVEALFRRLGDEIEDKATARALNRALDQSATQASREIRKVYNIKNRAVLKAMKKIRASKGRKIAVLRIQGAKIPLIEFDARWRPGQRVGATVKIKVGEGRKTVAGSFIAASTANNYQGGGSAGMRQVWRRLGKERYPIVTLRSLSIPSAFVNEKVLSAVKRVAGESFARNLAQQIKFLERR